MNPRRLIDTILLAVTAAGLLMASFGMYNDGFRRGYEQCEVDSDIGAWEPAPQISTKEIQQ